MVYGVWQSFIVYVVLKCPLSPSLCNRRCYEHLAVQKALCDVSEHAESEVECAGLLRPHHGLQSVFRAVRQAEEQQ